MIETVSPVLVSIAWFIVAYLVGALPIGFLIAKWAGVDDITRHGSGTMGATNVARTLGVPFFFLVFCIDAGKAALVMHYAPASVWPVCIIGLMVGNTCSIFLRGGGGKGVATLVGILAIINSSLLFFFLSVWGIMLLLLRSVGKASTCALYALFLWICLVERFFGGGVLVTVLFPSVGSIDSVWKYISLLLVIFGSFLMPIQPIHYVLLYAILWSLYCHRTHVVSLHDLFNAKVNDLF